MKKAVSFILTLLVVAALVIGVSMATTYVILKHDLDRRITSHKKTTTLIANQIKTANINSILAFTDEFFIFVLNQRDGRLLFESAKRAVADLKIWEENREALIKEILEKRFGTSTYPRVEPWQFLALRKRVEYQYIPDLDWIVAAEIPASVNGGDLAAVYTPIVWLILVVFCGATTALLSLGRRKEKEEEPFAEKFEESLMVASPIESPQESPLDEQVRLTEHQLESQEVQQEAIQEGPPQPHVIDRPQYTQRLIQEAQKILKPQPPAEKIEQPLLDEIEAKDHLRGASAHLQQEQATSAEAVEKKISKSQKQEIQEPKEKKASEIYFDHIISGSKGKKPKPMPNSIIGLAFSKKLNGEKTDPGKT